ncbi:hypothetical protein R1flu_002500 [Riccia fluitans]|uniref:Cilia- and flagella-associated protein 251 n=1 Tax=Riccia fluitans TaxID=41844 RepID=A0ABD1Y6T6_9MARC
MAYSTASTHEQQPLEMHWVYGFSNNISSGVVDLRTEMHSHTVGYIAGIVVVLYDIWGHTQKILQGHVHQIQCVAVTPDKSVLFTSDCGPEAALIMWDVTAAKAVKAISQERTSDGSHHVCLSQTCVRFNVNDHEELITNGKFRVFVWRHFKKNEAGTEEYFLHGHEGVIIPHELKQTVAEFTLSLFSPSTSTAMTATVEGDVVIWHQERAPRRLDSAQLTIHVPPFIVGTKSAHMRLLHAGLFEEQPGTRICKGEQVMKPMRGVVGPVAAHPSKPYFASVGHPSLLQIQDYTTKTVVMEREFSKNLKISCVQYSPLGSLLAVGFSNGVFKLLAADFLVDQQSFSYTRSDVAMVQFSGDGTYIATADNSCCVALLYCKLVKVMVDIKKTPSVLRDAMPTLHVSLLAADEKWECVGKYRSHAKTITGLMFAVGEDGANRLFSMGQDCMIIEYDLNKSFVDTGLKLKGSWLLNTLALPAAMTTSSSPNELQVMTSDEGFKVRIYDTERFHSIRTFLGPVFGTAIHKFCKISESTTSKNHLVYSTREDIIGLMTRRQGEDTVEERNLDQTLGAELLMDCYSGLGVFFSKKDLDGILDEINRPRLRKKQGPAARVNFDDFFRTYVAHKPVLQFDELTIQAAFNEIGADQATGKISLATLINNLMYEGEKMTREEIDECIKTCSNNDLDLDSLPDEGDGLWFFKDLLKLEPGAAAEKAVLFHDESQKI